MPVLHSMSWPAGNQNVPNINTAQNQLTSSLLYDESKNAFVATGSLPLYDDYNGYQNTIAVLFQTVTP